MKRYFDLPDTRNTLMVEVDEDSPAARAPAERIKRHFNQKGAIREIGKTEYEQLTEKYNEGEAQKAQE